MIRQPSLNPDALEAGAKALDPGVYRTFEADLVKHAGFSKAEASEYVDAKKRQLEGMARAAVSAYLAVAPPIVASVEEREELPVETVLLDADGAVFQYLTVLNGPSGWYMMGSDQPEDCMMSFPALVLYRPEAKP